jgi:hypothetical protein
MMGDDEVAHAERDYALCDANQLSVVTARSYL